MFWTGIFGVSEVALRSLSVVVGVVTVYVTYLIGKQVYNKQAGLLAALFLATSGLHIYYSQEARMYAMSALLVALAVYSFLNIKKNGFWIVFGLSTAAALFTHYITALIIPVFLTYVILDKKRNDYIKRYIFSWFFLGVGVLWLPTFLTQFSRGAGVGEESSLWASILGQTSLKEVFLVPAKFIFGRISINNNFFYTVSVLFAVIFFGYLIVRRYYNAAKITLPTGNDRLIWIWVTLPFLASAIIGFWIPVFGYFRLLFILPAFYLLLGAGVNSFKGRTFKVLVAIIMLINLVSTGIYLINPTFHREDWRSAYSFIKSNISRNSIVIFSGTGQHEAYDYYYVNDQEQRFGGIYNPELEPDLLASNTIKKLENQDMVWLMRYAQPIFDPEDLTRWEIEKKGYNKQSEHDFNGVVVWRYQK